LTDRKQAEEIARRLLEEQAARQAAEAAGRQLRASEERLRLFVEHAPAAVAMLDRDMRYLLVSKRRLQDLIGRNYYEVFPNVPERWKEVHRRCLAGASERCEEDRFIRPGGQEMWLRWEICPWRDQQSEIGGIIIFSEVITHRKRAQEALRQQREWLRVTLASIGDAVITTDTEGRVTFHNPVAESLTGWGQAQAQGQSLEEVFPSIHEQTRGSVENPVMKVIREGAIVGLGNHTVLLARDGTERPIDDSAAPIRGENGEIVGVVLIFRDVAEQRQADQALRVSEERFTRFMDHLPGLAWIKDLQGRYLYANDAAVTAFHLARAELYGKTDEEIFPPETAAQFRENDRRALWSRTGVQVIETLVGKGGILQHSIVSKSPFPGPMAGRRWSAAWRLTLPTACVRKRRSGRPTAAKTSSWGHWPTNSATRWPPSATPYTS
jgi:PAS domain S-box-containing protein